MVVTKGAFLTLVAAHAGDPEEGDVPEDERVAPPAPPPRAGNSRFGPLSAPRARTQRRHNITQRRSTMGNARPQVGGLGLGRIIALLHRSPTPYRIR